MSTAELPSIPWLLTQGFLAALGRVVHGHGLSNDCVFEAISYKEAIFVPGPATYKSALIMYAAPESNAWRVMLLGESPKSSVGASLEALLDQLREQMGMHMSESPTTLIEQGFCTLMLT